MRVLITGATGYIGSAIVSELIAAGHQVTGLARSDASSEALIAAGAAVARGSLDDLAALRAGAASADGVIHAAFTNVSPTTDFAAACQADVAAISALGAGLEGTGKPLVITSGTGLVGVPGRAATEEDLANWGPRVAGEERHSRSPAVECASPSPACRCRSTTGRPTTTGSSPP